MSIDRDSGEASQQGSPAATPAVVTSATGTADDGKGNRSAERAPNVMREVASQTKPPSDAAHDDTGEVTPVKARLARSKKSRDIAGNLLAIPEQTSTQPKPPARLVQKSIPAGKGLLDSTNAPSMSDKPKRSRRKTSTTAAERHDIAVPGADRAPLSGIPPITSEAIAFLNNPDATVTDLFKLAPAGQAFVRYHITNMERLEAESSLAHTRLLAAAPKHSPRFEKAVDAFITKLARDRSVLAIEKNSKTEPVQTAEAVSRKPGTYYGPYKHAVVVSLNTLAFPADAERSEESLQENSIEPGTPVKNMPYSSLDQQPSQSAADSTGVLNPASAGPSLRFVHGMTKAVQTAATWIQSMRKTILAKEPATAPISFDKPTVPVPERMTIVPDDVTRRFLKVEKEYYFPDRTPAFSDRGNKLATRGEHPEVVRSLVEIAIARGWNDVTIKGTESFRRAAWMEASRSGLKVVGYVPTPLDLTDLASRPGKNALEKGIAKERPHGLDQTDSKLAAGDLKTSARDQSSSSATFSVLDSELGAKARSFDNDKPSTVVKKHPDLAPAYGVIDAAKKFAESNLPETAREEFVGLARRHVLNKIISGDAIVGPKVYTAPAKARNDAREIGAEVEKFSDIEKPPKAKEVARER